MFQLTMHNVGGILTIDIKHFNMRRSYSSQNFKPTPGYKQSLGCKLADFKNSVLPHSANRTYFLPLKESPPTRVY